MLATVPAKLHGQYIIPGNGVGCHSLASEEHMRRRIHRMEYAVAR